jgi:hypothetical protein
MITLKTLYCSLFWSCLDYNSSLWSPHQLNIKHDIKIIQNRFLRFLFFNCNIYRAPHSSYVHLLNCLKLDFLELRRNKLDLIFLYNLINNLIDSSELLSMINFKVINYSLKNNDLHYPFSTSTNLMSNSPINQILKLANKYNIGPIVNSLYKFKININLVV